MKTLFFIQNKRYGPVIDARTDRQIAEFCYKLFLTEVPVAPFESGTTIPNSAFLFVLSFARLEKWCIIPHA